MTVGADTAASAPSNPTVILVGGLMTLEDGEELDSRQPVEGDPWSRIAQKTMATSLLWWIATSSVVEAIVDDAGPDAFALVIGPHTLNELRPDGKLRRRMLRAALTGGVSKLEIGVSGPKGRLNGRYQVVENAPLPGLRIGINFVPGTRWRLLDDEKLLPHVLPAIGPAVIVDTHWVRYAMRYEEFEASHLQGDVTLVLPHSDGAERHIRSVLEWVQDGRPLRLEEWEPYQRQLEHDERSWTPTPEAAIPRAAEFGVTGLYQDGDWRDPADLEAARAFLQSRFDLRIGIWDLARNPALRTSLLEPTAIRPVPLGPASVPIGSARRAAAQEAARQDEAQRREVFRRSMKRRYGGALRPLGWTSPDRRKRDQYNLWNSGDFVLPLTEAIPLESETTPLAWLTLTLNKRTTRVSHVAFSDHYMVVRLYLDPRRELLSEIAKPGKCDFRIPDRHILWEERGGWGDDVDWPRRMAELQEKTSLWLDVFKDLRPELLRANRKSS